MKSFSSGFVRKQNMKSLNRGCTENCCMSLSDNTREDARRDCVFFQTLIRLPSVSVEGLTNTANSNLQNKTWSFLEPHNFLRLFNSRFL